MPNLRHLCAVQAIVRQGSLRRAADEAALSQPALTQAIAKLERHLGVTLFDRGPTGMAPRPAGRLLAARVGRIEALLRRMTRLMGAHSAPLDRTAGWNQLLSLLAAVETGGATAAARRLYIAQPVLTRRLRSFEALAGRTLFRRSAAGLEPSPAARVAARLASLALAEWRHGIDELREYHGRHDGRLVIGCLPLARSVLLPEAVTRLLDRHPDLRVRIVDGRYGDLLADLRSGRIDLLIGALRDPAPAPDISQTALFSDPLSIVVGPGHAILGLADPDPRDLATLDWVAAPEGTPARAQFSRFFASHGLAEPARVIECSSLIVLRGLLRRSARAGLLSRAQAEIEIAAGLLAVLPRPLPGTDRPIGIATRADWQPTAAQAEFLDILRAVVADLRMRAD